MQVQGLPHAVRVDVGDDQSCEWTWLTLEEAEQFAVALAIAREAIGLHDAQEEGSP